MRTLIGLLLISALSFTLAQSTMGMVRVAHLSPNAPAVDILINGKVAIHGLAFKQVTNYIALPAGSYQVEVVPSGMMSPVVAKATLNVEAGSYLTVAAIGFLPDIHLKVYTDNIRPFPVAGQAFLRVIHASPDAPAVDVRIAGGPTLIQDLSYPEATDYLAVNAGTYHLQVTLAGTDQIVLNLPDVTLDSGHVYTVFAIGSVKDQTLGVLVTTDAEVLGGTQ
jgi:hypothetical protein